MQIRHYKLINCLIAAPIFGITDRLFRALCHIMSARMTVCKMLFSNPEKLRTDKSRLAYAA